MLLQSPILFIEAPNDDDFGVKGYFIIAIFIKIMNVQLLTLWISGWLFLCYEKLKCEKTLIFSC